LIEDKGVYNYAVRDMEIWRMQDVCGPSSLLVLMMSLRNNLAQHILLHSTYVYFS